MAALVAGLGAMLVMLVLGVLVGTVVLILACKICRVKTPSFLKALGIVLITVLAGFVVNLVLTFLLHAVGLGAIGIQLVTGLVGLVVCVLLYMPLLPASFGKALLVCIVEAIMALALLMVVSMLGVGLASFIAGLHGRS